MGKFFVRFTILFVAIYLIASSIFAQFGYDILRYSYMLLFELCVVVYSFSEGKYHCKFMKWTMLGVFFADCISHLDYYVEFLSVFQYNFLIGLSISTGCTFSCISAIRHFMKVRNLKRELNEIRQRNSGEDK